MQNFTGNDISVLQESAESPRQSPHLERYELYGWTIDESTHLDAHTAHSGSHQDPIRAPRTHPQQRMDRRVDREQLHLDLTGLPHLELLHALEAVRARDLAVLRRAQVEQEADRHGEDVPERGEDREGGGEDGAGGGAEVGEGERGRLTKEACGEETGSVASVRW